MNEITGLFITDCSDDSLWYADKVGQVLDYDGYCCVEKKYRSCSDNGRWNWVALSDCKIIKASVATQALQIASLQIAAQEIINDLNNDGEINEKYRSVKNLAKALNCIK